MAVYHIKQEKDGTISTWARQQVGQENRVVGGFKGIKYGELEKAVGILADTVKIARDESRQSRLRQVKAGGQAQ